MQCYKHKTEQVQIDSKIFRIYDRWNISGKILHNQIDCIDFPGGLKLIVMINIKAFINVIDIFNGSPKHIVNTGCNK